jgi:pilus assembly protein Flp/PilA
MRHKQLRTGPASGCRPQGARSATAERASSETERRKGVNRPSIKKEVTRMKKLLLKTRELIRSEEGATATEYAVMLALIIIVAIGAITILGKKVNNTFQNIANQLPNN